MTILICGECEKGKISQNTLKAIAAGQTLEGTITVFLLAQTPEDIQAIKETPENIALIQSIIPAYTPEIAANLLTELAQEYKTIVAPASTIWKNILPRVAALLDTMMVSDVIKIVGNNHYVRPIYAGNALQTVENTQEKQIFTIRPSAFEPCKIRQAEPENIYSKEASTVSYASQFISAATPELERPELTSANIVVSGGRGVGSKENFGVIEKLADYFGAAIGASRAAVDAGYAPNDYQVGQTGKIVAPELYIAVGISGAIQHLAGMKDSKVIIAINKDPEAPIFAVADYGIVMDLFEAVDQITKALE